MVRFCMHPGCDQKAAWLIHTSAERGGFLVCPKHRQAAIANYEKRGYTPVIDLAR